MNVNEGTTATSSSTTMEMETGRAAKRSTSASRLLNIVSQRPTAASIDVEELARVLATTLIPARRDGGTYDPRTQSMSTFDDGHMYIVSVPGFEHRLRGVPRADRLTAWLARVRRALEADRSYLGWWRAGGELVFDISIAIRGDREAVLATARAWGQHAVYHPVSDEVLYLAPESERAA